MVQGHQPRAYSSYLSSVLTGIVHVQVAVLELLSLQTSRTTIRVTVGTFPPLPSQLPALHPNLHGNPVKHGKPCEMP